MRPSKFLLGGGIFDKKKKTFGDETGHCGDYVIVPVHILFYSQNDLTNVSAENFS